MADKLLKTFDVPKDVRKLDSCPKSVEIYADRVVCLGMSQGDKTFFFKNYVGVEWERGNLARASAIVIFLTQSGSVDPTINNPFSALFFSNKIAFNSGGFTQRKANEYAEEVYREVKKAMDAYQSAPPVQSAPSVSSVADEIRKFKELLDAGAITQAEFDAKKKQLLGL